MNSNCTGCSPVVLRDRRDTARLLVSVLACFLAFSGIATESGAANLSKVSAIVPGYFSSNRTNDMPTADFDGDGLPDIVVPGSLDYSSVIQIVGVQAGLGWKIKQVIIPDIGDQYYEAPNLATWTDAAGAHLLYAQSNSISIYGGWPLTLEREIRLENYVDFNDAQVADVNNDGIFELIATSTYSGAALKAYSLNNGAELWTVATPSNYYAKLNIAQLDADPAYEIVLTGAPGKVIDGATHALEWEYKDGFGEQVQHGRFGGSYPRFAAFGYNLVMFQGQLWSPLWDMIDIDARSTTVADIDGDQIDELITATYYFPSGVQIIDVQTQSVRTSFGDSSILQLAAADFDGDPAIEIAVGRAPGYERGDPFRVFNASSGVDEFAIPEEVPGPYMAGGFIADAGTLDLIFGSASAIVRDGTIMRVDSNTGAVRWRSSATDPNFRMYSVRNLQVTQLEGQAQPAIIAAGGGYYSDQNKIVALSSVDGSALWGIGSTNSDLPDYVLIEAMATIDLNGNQQTDAVLTCTSESRLRLFDTTNHSQIWSSVAMSGNCVGALQMPSNGNQLLVAVMNGSVRAYDAQSHLLSWSLPYPNGIAGATYLPNGANGPELALFNNYSISFFDAETRNLLRELNLQNNYPVRAIAQSPGASIHDLAVTINGKLYSFDGVSGAMGAASEPLGLNAGQYNQLAVYANPDGSALVAAGSDVAVSTYRLDGLSDEIFANGFESVAP
ncbi:hypothetical protein [Dokdonella sp.]|uniref:hypothetical protein n=1 Tax=Dokdonella sp. TaxID=2291710 RepID=UPI003C41E35B